MTKVAIGTIVGLLIGSTTALGSGVWRTTDNFNEAEPVYQIGYIEGMADTISVIVASNKNGENDHEWLAHLDTCLDRHTDTNAGASAATFRDWAIKAAKRSADKGYGGDVAASSVLVEACN